MASEMKNELLVSIAAENEDARAPAPRSIDFKMFNASIFFFPTIALLMFEFNYSAAHGVPAAAREKAEFLFPVYGAVVTLAIVTSIFAWMFRGNGMTTSAGILNGINAFLVCLAGAMLVWELMVLQAYHFFVMVAAGFLFTIVFAAVSEWCRAKK